LREFFALLNINIKQKWRQEKVNICSTGLASALKNHGLAFESTHHRGIDDALNITRVLMFTET